VLRWNGSSWRVIESPTTSRLDEVWGSGASDVWASGDAGTFRWDGSRWTALSRSAGDEALADVWGSGECAVWAVGAGGTLVRRDCQGWSAVASGVTEDLHGVGGSGPADVWFVGDGGVILRFDGRSVSKVASPVRWALRSVWARSGTDAWAVGDRGTIVRWNGRVWTEVAGPVVQALRRVRGEDASVLAVGDGVLIAWDGAQWSKVPGPPYCRAGDGGPDRLTGLVVVHRDDLWITCDSAGLLHWTGKDWEMPGGQGEAISYHDVVGESDDLMVVGWYGTVVRRRGRAWTVEQSGTAQPLRSGWRSPRGHLWVVGDDGTILSHAPGAASAPRAD
jgi:hypothetical protein